MKQSIISEFFIFGIALSLSIKGYQHQIKLSHNPIFEQSEKIFLHSAFFILHFFLPVAKST